MLFRSLCSANISIKILILWRISPISAANCSTLLSATDLPVDPTAGSNSSGTGFCRLVEIWSRTSSDCSSCLPRHLNTWAFSIYKTNIKINVIRSSRYSYPIVTSVTDKRSLQGEHVYSHRPLNRALIPTLSHPKSGI